MTYISTGQRPRPRLPLAGVNVPTNTGWVTVAPGLGDTFRAVGNGDASKLKTAGLIARLAKAQQFDPLVLETAQALAMRVPSRDVDGICFSIRSFMARNFFFIEDTRDADAVREPARQLEYYYSGAGMRGDCDCAAALGLALGLAVGRDGRLVLLGFRDVREEYTHIYAELLGGSGWVDLDTTKPAGETPPIARRTVIAV